MADFAGFPSSVIEGTYREGDMTLNTSRRNVIATSGHDKYLVSLSVTTDRAVAVGDAPATDAIINGFRVTVPGPGSAPAPAPGRSSGRLPRANAAGAGRRFPHKRPAAAPAGLPAQAAVPTRWRAPQPDAESVGPGARPAAAAELHVPHRALILGHPQSPRAGRADPRPASYCEAHGDRGRAVHVCGGGFRRVRDLVALPQPDRRHHALALRAMAPTQLAAAIMLAAGGVVALAASPHTALVVVIVCVAGALGTLAAGSWQSARFALRQEAQRGRLRRQLRRLHAVLPLSGPGFKVVLGPLC